MTEPYAPDANQSGKRALGMAVMAMQNRFDGGKAAAAQFASADNMTLQLSALAGLVRVGAADQALPQFETQWRHDRLVMDKWFGLQISASTPDKAVDVARELTGHPDFDLKNPNRFRAVLGALAGHHAAFHAADGDGYALLADWLIKLDPLNPQTTARMTGAFQSWKRYDTDRQGKIREQLDRILSQPNLSRDTTEMVTRIREA